MKPNKMIPLDQIDLSDETFSVNYLPDLQRLRSSIEEVGLIQPVFLRERPGRYQIVSGFRRISAVKGSGKPEIESRVVKENEMDESRLYFLSLQENLTTRGFNTVEKAIGLDKLIHRFQVPSEKVIKTFLPLFSLEPDEKILNTYLSLVRMEDQVKRYVLKEEVSRSNIRRFGSLTPDDRMTVLSLISLLRLGENRLREILTLLEDISRRNQCNVREIVDRLEIQAILSQQELTPSQRTERVKKVLMALRYPKMDQMEKAFEKTRRDLHLPSNLTIHHPSFFEGKGLRVGFEFETMEEYQAILESLSNLTHKKEFKELIQSVW